MLGSYASSGSSVSSSTSFEYNVIDPGVGTAEELCVAVETFVWEGPVGLVLVGPSLWCLFFFSKL